MCYKSKVKNKDILKGMRGGGIVGNNSPKNFIWFLFIKRKVLGQKYKFYDENITAAYTYIVRVDNFKQLLA